MGPARIGNAVTSYLTWSFALYVLKPTLLLMETAVELLRRGADADETDDAPTVRMRKQPPRPSQPHAPHAI